MKKQKQNSAITLIALIITIIVLLILAGVTINMVMGENGLINKSKSSVGAYENAQIKENATLSDFEGEMDKYLGNSISAGDISFTPEDPNWNVTNVKDALDYLYNN